MKLVGDIRAAQLYEMLDDVRAGVMGDVFRAQRTGDDTSVGHTSVGQAHTSVAHQRRTGTF